MEGLRLGRAVSSDGAQGRDVKRTENNEAQPSAVHDPNEFEQSR
jgi:hypothetical protein